MRVNRIWVVRLTLDGASRISRQYDGSCISELGASKDDLDGAFMVGMFSLLDKLFGSALSEVLQPLQLREDILHALLYRSGKLGQCLCLVELADRTNTMALNEQTRLLELDADSYYDCICDAYVWVNQVCRDM
jgi:EAL and modified HD-GYP domain-containing signal transduction protein